MQNETMAIILGVYACVMGISWTILLENFFESVHDCYSFCILLVLLFAPFVLSFIIMKSVIKKIKIYLKPIMDALEK